MCGGNTDVKYEPLGDSGTATLAGSQRRLISCCGLSAAGVPAQSGIADSAVKLW